MSKLTAEAEQLVNREGPLYDEMISNLQLPTIESAGALARENTEQLRRAMQRGGAARRTAMDAVQKIRAQERINSAKVQQLSQTRFELDKWSRENAKSTLEFGQNWASNLGGIRESYQGAMDQASELMLTKALPLVFDAEAGADSAERRAEEVRAKMHAENRQKTSRWVGGILSVASMFTGGGLLSGALATAGMTGAMGGSSSEMLGAAAGGLAKGVLGNLGKDPGDQLGLWGKKKA